MNMNFATWGRLMMSVLPPCSSTITAMSPPLASTDMSSPPQDSDLTSPPSAEKTSTSTPPPSGWVQNPVLTAVLHELILPSFIKLWQNITIYHYFFSFAHFVLSFKSWCCTAYSMNTDPLGLCDLAWMRSAFRDSAIVKLNFSEERPPKPPRLYLSKAETPVSMVNSLTHLYADIKYNGFISALYLLRFRCHYSFVWFM